MACCNNYRSGRCSNCNNGYARVNYGCSNCGSWNNWNNWNNWNHCGSSCGYNTCGCSNCTSGSNCCHSCGSCSTRSGCSCSSGCDTWVNGRSGCGSDSCSTCNHFGVLRSIAGPFSRGGRPKNFPFYTGPCGPCENSCDCCCDDCCDPCCDPCCETCCNDCCDPCACNTALLSGDCDSCHSSATFTASTPVELAPGDAVCLASNNANTDDFIVTQEGIRILRAGSYMVIYTVHVPANQPITSRFALALNGDRISASALDVSTATDCTTNGYTMHAMLDVNAGDVLKLVSRNPVSIEGSSASNVFTLSIHRIP